MSALATTLWTKATRDATTVRELIEMYNQQKKIKVG